VERRRKPNGTLNQLLATTLEREARPLSNLKKGYVLVRRFRLGRLKFLFHADRIDHIAAVAKASCTDRSKSRWKQKPPSQKEEEASQIYP
jgi:hypothetical protein